MRRLVRQGRLLRQVGRKLLLDIAGGQEASSSSPSRLFVLLRRKIATLQFVTQKLGWALLDTTQEEGENLWQVLVPVVEGQIGHICTTVTLQQFMESPMLKPLVTLTGTAKEAAVGPPLGSVDIGVCESAYLFRVSLPGVRGSQNKLKCNIQLSGRVHIEGEVTESQFVKSCAKLFEMKVQQLCPPGPFSVSFNLPGPVDPRLCSISFKPGGILEVIVLKFRMPHLSAEGWFEKWYDCWSLP